MHNYTTSSQLQVHHQIYNQPQGSEAKQLHNYIKTTQLHNYITADTETQPQGSEATHIIDKQAHIHVMSWVTYTKMIGRWAHIQWICERDMWQRWHRWSKQNRVTFLLNQAEANTPPRGGVRGHTRSTRPEPCGRLTFIRQTLHTVMRDRESERKGESESVGGSIFDSVDGSFLFLLLQTSGMSKYLRDSVCPTSLILPHYTQKVWSTHTDC